VEVILACPERVKVGCIPAAERRRFGGAASRDKAAGNRERKPIDRAGPTLLVLLLCSSFVPALLSEFDAAKLLQMIQAALIALAQQTHCFVSGEQRRPGTFQDIACSSGGRHVADSAALVFDGRAMAIFGLPGRLSRASRARRRRRIRGPSSPRAPPGSPLLPPVPERDQEPR